MLRCQHLLRSTTTALVRCSSSVPAAKESVEAASVAETKFAEIQESKPATNIYRPPHYRKVHRHHKAQHLLQEEFPNAGDESGAGARLFDYYKTADLVNALPTIKEKIDFVSPFERPWTRAEKTWRRDWHPSLLATRKAWSVPRVPAYFDSLNYYKYITKTRVENESLDDLYATLNPSTAVFEKTLSETILSLHASTKFDSDGERVDTILASAVDEATMALAHNVTKLADYRTAYDSQSEAFWIRAGFMFLYDFPEISSGEDVTVRKLHNAAKYIGDDRRKLGELAFVSRDRLAAQIRSRVQLKDAFPIDSSEVEMPVFEESVDVNADVIFSPKVFNMWPDEDILWQCPGYFAESGESHPFGRLAVKSVADLNERCKYWGIGGDLSTNETFVECLQAQAVASLFTTLCAQAHTQGFTQYTDITRPFSSQLILSNGKQFAFAFGQLNTLAINVECDGFVNDRTNYVRFEGPFNLYDGVENGKFFHYTTVEGGKTERVEGMNERVLSRIMQMIVRD